MDTLRAVRKKKDCKMVSIRLRLFAKINPKNLVKATQPL